MGVQPAVALVWWGGGFLRTGARLDNFMTLSGSCPEPERPGQSQGAGRSFSFPEKKRNEMERGAARQELHLIWTLAFT